MKAEHKRLIRELRDDLVKIAKKSQVIVKDLGYNLSFNIDSNTGTITHFEVKAPVSIDDDEEESPTGRAN